MLHFLNQFAVEGLLLGKVPFELRYSVFQLLALLIPTHFLVREQLNLVVEIFHDPIERVRAAGVISQALVFLHGE